jgi:hypothetical protein
MKWTRTTPITAADAESEPLDQQLFGPSYEARQARAQREIRIDRDPWKKPRIQRKAS